MAAARSFRVKSNREEPRARSVTAPRTLTIDIGGTGIKMLPTDSQGKPLADRSRELTPQPSHPRAVMDVIKKMLNKQGEFERVSVGFPGVVVHGVVQTAHNLGTERWRGFDLKNAIEKATGKPVRAMNDVDLQGYGAIRGAGVELVLTLGTGLGSALYTNGHLTPNLEIAHHLFDKGRTYEQRVSNNELKRIGKKKWSTRVTQIIERLEPVFNYDVLYLGGGNAKKLIGKLPNKVKLFENVEGMQGGIRLWDDDVQQADIAQ